MILVIGGTGVLGFEICRLLRARGKAVRAVVRPSSPRMSDIRALGVEVFEGDIRSADVVAAACNGATAVISTATAMAAKDARTSLRAIDRDAQLSLVEQADRSGVSHFVYVSISPNYAARAPLMRYKREVERAIRSSSMSWTILQPSNFMEIWLGKFLGWDIANGKATIFGAGTAPVSWISVSDVAQYSVLALEEQRMRNQVIPLGGPAAIAPNDVVMLFERITGRKFKVKRIPAVILRLLWPVIAVVNEKQASGMALGAQTSNGDVVTSELQRSLPVTLTTLEEYARRGGGPAQS